MKLSAIAAVLAVTLAACNHPPADEQLISVAQDYLRAIDLGAPPSEEQVVIAARAALELSLKDAESARYRFDRMARGYIGHYKKARYGWVGIVLVNSKNTYGAYAGFEPRFIFFPKEGQPSDITELIQRRKAGVL